MCRSQAAGGRLQAADCRPRLAWCPTTPAGCSLQPVVWLPVSLRLRFTLYLLVVHALLATAGVYLLREHRLWLFGVEAVFVASLLTGVALVRRMFRALAFVGDSAQFLNDSDYTARFLAVGQPEIDRLIGVYNRMVDSLRAERQRVHEQHY